MTETEAKAMAFINSVEKLDRRFEHTKKCLLEYIHAHRFRSRAARELGMEPKALHEIFRRIDKGTLKLSTMKKMAGVDYEQGIR